MKLITTIYNLLWGDLITIPLPGGGSLGLSLLVLLLIPAGIFFTIRTRFLPVRMFPEMMKTALEKRSSSQKNSISGFQTLIIATATRVGMGNLVGVVGRHLRRRCGSRILDVGHSPFRLLHGFCGSHPGPAP